MQWIRQYTMDSAINQLEYLRKYLQTGMQILTADSPLYTSLFPSPTIFRYPASNSTFTISIKSFLHIYYCYDRLWWFYCRYLRLGIIQCLRLFFVFIWIWFIYSSQFYWLFLDFAEVYPEWYGWLVFFWYNFIPHSSFYSYHTNFPAFMSFIP